VTLSLREAQGLRRDAPHVRYGDLLELRGTLATPPTFADFDYREYLARQGVHVVMSFPRVTLLAEGLGSQWLAQVYALRHRLAHGLQQSLPEPQSSLSQALLLGLRAELPSDVQEAFIATGTSHLLAVSGQNVAVLLGVVLLASTVILGGGRWALLVPLGATWLYAFLSGMAPPVARAAIMGSLYLGGQFAGRQSMALPALAAAAAVMVGLEPQLLRDVSFQLSFTAVAGIALLAPPIEAWLTARASRWTDSQDALFPLVRAFNIALAVGVAATLGTLPLIAFTFHRVSLVGIPATMLALPALPLMLVGSAATGALALLWGPLGLAAGWVTWVPLTYLLGLVDLTSRIPGITFDIGPVAPAAVGAFYGLLLLFLGHRVLTGWLCSLRQVAPRASAIVRSFWGTNLWAPRLPLRWAILPMALAAVILWGAALASPDGKLHVTVLDVGQGDAILIITPSGRQVLVDGGPDPGRAVRALGARMPFWDRSLDLVVLTHLHQDHLQGLTEVLERYRVAVWVQPPKESTPPASEKTLEALQRRAGRARILEAVAGQEVHLGDGAVLRFLHPGERLLAGTRSDIDNNSLVMRLDYGEVSFLLAADIYAEAEQALLARKAPLSATVLKVGHHGSGSASSVEFLNTVAPAVAVISAGRENRFGHPHPETLARLQSRVGPGLALLTSERGDIHLSTDGKRLWLDTGR
jgi:competence protein ComEC